MMTNQEFYALLDNTCARMREAGLAKEAARLAKLLHGVAWTTSTELFEELETAIRDIIVSPSIAKAPEGVRRELDRYLSLLGQARGR